MVGLFKLTHAETMTKTEETDTTAKGSSFCYLLFRNTCHTDGLGF
jgi:hypothetical protein